MTERPPIGDPILVASGVDVFYGIHLTAAFQDDFLDIRVALCLNFF